MNSIAQGSGFWQLDCMIDPDITEFYELGFEDGRLFINDRPRLEFVRTMELVERSLPTESARIIDIGGGTGIYAHALANQGHTVTVVDPVELHVTRSMERLSAQAGSSAEVGDARSLDHEGDAFDAALMLGPLYHLVDPEDRRSAWNEAVRVVRPGGVVVGVGISRFASLLDGIKRGLVLDPEFRPIIEQDLATGRHHNPDVTGRPEFFTTAYFHHPDALKAEAVSAGLRDVELLAVEGPGWLVESIESLESQLEAVRLVESEPTLLGASSHIAAIGIVPKH